MCERPALVDWGRHVVQSRLPMLPFMLREQAVVMGVALPQSDVVWMISGILALLRLASVVQRFMRIEEYTLGKTKVKAMLII